MRTTLATSIPANRSPGRLVLEDGTVLRGRLFGALTETVGELVFNTSISW